MDVVLTRPNYQIFDQNSTRFSSASSNFISNVLEPISIRFLLLEVILENVWKH